jgi:hypothetical protein
MAAPPAAFIMAGDPNHGGMVVVTVMPVTMAYDDYDVGVGGRGDGPEGRGGDENGQDEFFHDWGLVFDSSRGSEMDGGGDRNVDCGMRIAE